MSYGKLRSRRGRVAMAGLSSRAPGLPVSRKALTPLSGYGPPHWYTAMQGASLGDDVTPTAQSLTVPTLADPATVAYQQQMVAAQQQMIAAMNSMVSSTQGYMSKETIQRWIQIAATLSIPLAAAVWRMIFRGGAAGVASTP